jgi:hypothetical protein
MGRLGWAPGSTSRLLVWCWSVGCLAWSGRFWENFEAGQAGDDEVREGGECGELEPGASGSAGDPAGDGWPRWTNGSPSATPWPG